MQALCFPVKRTNRRTLFLAATELSTETTHAAYLKYHLHRRPAGRIQSPIVVVNYSKTAGILRPTLVMH